MWLAPWIFGLCNDCPPPQEMGQKQLQRSQISFNAGGRRGCIFWDTCCTLSTTIIPLSHHIVALWCEYIYIYQINANDKAGQFQQMGAQAVDQFSWNIVQHSAEKILAKPRLQWVLWNGQRPWRFARWCTTAACHVKSQDHWTFLRFSTGTLHAS